VKWKVERHVADFLRGVERHVADFLKPFSFVL